MVMLPVKSLQVLRMSVINTSDAPTQPGLPADVEKRTLQILVVDDDATQRTLISLAAKQAGHSVIMAASCADAIREMHNVRFDCVTLDLMLSDGDGTDVLKIIAETNFAGPVVVISGMDAARRTAAPPRGSTRARSALSCRACRSPSISRRCASSSPISPRPPWGFPSSIPGAA